MLMSMLYKKADNALMARASLGMRVRMIRSDWACNPLLTAPMAPGRQAQMLLPSMTYRV